LGRLRRATLRNLHNKLHAPGESLLSAHSAVTRRRSTLIRFPEQTPNSLELRTLIHSRLLATRKPQSAETSSNCSAQIGSTANRASLGFFSPTAYPNKGSDQHRGSVPGCAAPSGFLNLLTRYSTLALLALFHARSAPGVEALRGFPLPVAALRLSPRAAPPAICSSRDGTKRWRRSEERHVGNARENDTSAPLRRATPRHRPESPAHHAPRSMTVKRPNESHVAQGFVHLEGPFSVKWCYPAFTGRASLSLCGPLRGPLPSSLGSALCRASSHGLAFDDG
jgi:hypothetical protein